MHWDETEFSLDQPLPVVVPLFHQQKDCHYNCRASFSVTWHCKNFAKNQTCLICNKDGLALKTSTKMVVYTNAYICPGNIWWVFIIRVNTRANIMTLVKIHWQLLFNKFLCSVWTQILCYGFFDKYSLQKKHCPWELSLRLFFLVCSVM